MKTNVLNAALIQGIRDYYARKLNEELDVLWNNGTLNQHKLNELRSQHLRTPYIEQNETEYISKEKILAGIDAGLKDIKDGRTQSLDDFIKELKEEE